MKKVPFLLPQQPNTRLPQNGKTPALIAAEKDFPNIVQQLVNAGADMNKEDKVRWSTGSVWDTKRLQDGDDGSQDGKTPLAVAKEKDHDEVVAIIKAGPKRGLCRACCSLW